MLIILISFNGRSISSTLASAIVETVSIPCGVGLGCGASVSPSQSQPMHACTYPCVRPCTPHPMLTCVTRPKTVCLLSSHGVGTTVMKNWEPVLFGVFVCVCVVDGHDMYVHKYATHRRSILQEHAHTVGAGPRVGHGDGEGAVVAEGAVELVLELPAPDGLAPRPVPLRVARLDHEALLMFVIRQGVCYSTRESR